MAFIFTFPLRIAQGVLALLILILTAYVVHNWTWPHGDWSPSEANFLLFCSVWTLLALAYLIIAPARFAYAAHKFGILAVEALTAIFWFAGWIALASLLGDMGAGTWRVKRVAEAAVVFAAIEWLLFTATMIMATLHVWRTRHERSGKHDPAMDVRADPRV